MWRIEDRRIGGRSSISGRGKVPHEVLDVKLPGLSGLDLQKELAKADLQIAIIFLTGHGDIPMSVRAMKSGALEFLTKPFDGGALLDAIWQGIASYRKVPNKRKNGVKHGPHEIIGASAAWKAVLNQVASVATPADSTVRIQGETGTECVQTTDAVAHAPPRPTLADRAAEEVCPTTS